MSGLYDDDIVLWSQRQGSLLRRRAAGERVNDAEVDCRTSPRKSRSMGRAEQEQLIRPALGPAGAPVKVAVPTGPPGQQLRLTILE